MTKLTHAGLPVAGSPFTGGGVVHPGWLASDGTTDDVWATNPTSVGEFSGSGVPLSRTAGYMGGGIFGLPFPAIG